MQNRDRISALQNPGAWLAVAAKDLAGVRKCLRDDDETLELSAYHLQQAVEKAFKALLAFHKKPIPKTHDLVRLLELCVEVDPASVQWKDDARDLSEYHTNSRYPDDFFIVTRPEVEFLFEEAKKIYSYIRERVIIKKSGIAVPDEQGKIF